MRKRGLILAGLIGAPLVAAAVIGESQATADQHSPAYSLVQVTRGPVTTKVIAAGTVQPALNVVVGSQISGQVQDILADFNDVVRRGQPIARLDPDLFTTRVEAARATVEAASSAVRIARDEADAANAAVAMAMAERDRSELDAKRASTIADNAARHLQRKSILVKSGTTSVSDVDDARVAYETALADAGSTTARLALQGARVQEATAQLAVARGRIDHADADLKRSQAELNQADADLARTVIRAPIDGIIIERSINAGQTVAASFQAPNLFTIGDLHTVNVEIAVDEADIGGLRAGQKVTFSVDAYLERTFSGRITQVRKAPHTQENVVTYTVVASAGNDNLALLPGMTANAEIVTSVTPDALQVPSAALRYKPGGTPAPAGAHVWAFDERRIYPVPVEVGASNKGMSEIVGGTLSEGQEIVVGDAAAMHVATPSDMAKRARDWLGKPVHAAMDELGQLANRACQALGRTACPTT